jgi:hypothetical protein
MKGMSMQYQEFLKCVKKRTSKTAGEGGMVTINHIIKNNGFELDGLVIMEKDRHISPTIYLNNFYEQYEAGRNLEEIIAEIEQIYTEHKDSIHVNPDDFSDFNTVKKTIVYKVINYEKNIKLLEKVPYKRILDLAVVFYCLLEQRSEGNATALIYNSHVESWNVTEDDIYQAALNNTPQLLESIIKPMSTIIQEIMNEEEFIADSEEPGETSKEMFILTNRSKINGAACILYEDVLFDFAEKIRHDLYILPSSIHEVILLPKLEAFNKCELQKMVREVNSEGVSLDEILSDNVYEYNRKDGMLSL